MAISPWIQPHIKFPETGEITSFLFARKSWQIYQDDKGTRILITTPELMDWWVQKKFIDISCVHTFKVSDKKHYSYFLSPSRYSLSPVKYGDITHDYPTAYALAMALSSSRELDKESDLNFGIFTSLFRKILPGPVPASSHGDKEAEVEGKSVDSDISPTEKAHTTAGPGFEPGVEGSSETPREQDERLLLSWLTKGAIKKLEEESKLIQLVKWLSFEQLSRVLHSAGITLENILWQSRKGDSPDIKTVVIKRPTEGIIFKSKEKLQTRKKEKGPDPARPPRFSLPGRRELEAFFNEHIVEVINAPEKYKKMGIDNPSAVILHGPPGCGKTFAVDQLVKYLGLPSFYVNSGTVASPYIHDSSKKISAIFDKAIGAAPSILVVDEMEAYMGHRSSGASQQHQVEEVAEFLRRIPDAIDKKVIIIAMTNLLEFIDTALLRQGRFDHKIKLDLPDRIDIKSALQAILSKRPCDENLDIEPVVDQLAKRPLSDCNFVVREASRLVVRRDLEKLDQAILLEAATHLPPIKTKADIGF